MNDNFITDIESLAKIANPYTFNIIGLSEDIEVTITTKKSRTLKEMVNKLEKVYKSL